MSQPSFPKSVVGIDLETSALAPEEGTIIEIAALRFDTASGEIIDSFEQLCRPLAPLNPEVTALTGLTNADLQDKPLFSEIAKAAQAFIGQDILFAHNASFDIGWLAYHGVELANPVWDTFMLSHLAWPQADSYNLGALAAMLQLAPQGEHRAGEDVKATWPLLQACREQLNVSRQTYEKIAHILAAAGEAHYLPLFTQSSKRISTKAVAADTPNLPTYPAGEKVFRTLLTQEGIMTVKTPLGHSSPSLYIRPLQKHSGKGKVALAPASRRLHNYLAATLGGSVSLKERRHYLCGYRLAQILKQPKYHPRAIWALLKAVIASEAEGLFDLEKLNLSHLDTSLLDLITSDSLVCRQQCSQHKPLRANCGYQIALANVRKAPLVIIRQAVLFSEDFLADEPLGAIDTLVIDEAEAASDMAAYASRIDFSSLRVAEIIAAFKQKTPHGMNLDELLTGYQRLIARAKGHVLAADNPDAIALTAAVRRHTSWQAWLKEGQEWLNRFTLALGLYRSQVSEEEGVFHRSAEAFAIQFATFLQGSPERIQAVVCDYKTQKIELYDAAADTTPVIEASLSKAARAIFISPVAFHLGLEGEDTPIDFAAESKKYSDSLFLYTAQDSPDPKAENFPDYIAEATSLLAEKEEYTIFCLFTSKKLLRDVYRKLARTLNKEKISLLGEGETGGRANILRKLLESKESTSTVILGTHSLLEAVSEAGIPITILCISKLPFARMDDPAYQFLTDKQGSYTAFSRFMIPRLIRRLTSAVHLLVAPASPRSKNKSGRMPHKVIFVVDRRLIEKGYGREIKQSLPAGGEMNGGIKELAGAVEKWLTGKASGPKNDPKKRDKMREG